MKIHIVKKGDTLYMIAQKYNVSLEEVLKLNPNIANPDMIDVGMKVKIPTSMTSNMEIMHQHAVQQGDTLWKLSKAWGIPLSDMIKANPQLKNPNALLTGELVNIPKSGTSSGMHEMYTTQHPFGGSSHSPHTPLHPMSVMQGVQGLMGKIPTAPFVGKKPTGEKPFTAPMADMVPMQAPVSMPQPAAVPAPLPAPITMPIAQQPAQKKAYPMQIEYEEHIDLFQQYGTPATEVMSMYDMPQMQAPVSPAAQMPYGHGYGYPATYPSVYPATTGGYGYPQPMAAGMVSPAADAVPDWCPPDNVMGAAALPWGAPSKVHFGSWGQQMTGLYQTQDDCGPELVSPAEINPYGGGYGYDHQMVSPLGGDPYCEAESYGYGHGAGLGTHVGVGVFGGGGGSYGFEPAMVSPASVGGLDGGGGCDCGPTMVSPAGVGGYDGGGGSYGFGPQMASPAGVGGYDGGGGSYGFGSQMVSPAGVGGYDGGGGSYGFGSQMVSPVGVGGYDGGVGSYGFGPQMVSPASAGGFGGGGGAYGYAPSMVSPAGVGGFGGGYPSGVSPSAAGVMGAPFQSYNYVGYGQVSPLQTAGFVKKPCDCGCKDRVDDADVRVDKVELPVKLPKSGKPAKSRKTAAKASIRTTRQPENKRRSSLPWINR